MIKAREQAERYAKALPTDHGWPPFLITTDIAHTFELYADFSLTGKAYVPFPDIRTYRIKFADLAHDEALRDRLRRVWLDPLSLDPTRRSARVTRQIADHLAALARDLELNSGFDPHRVAAFLMRCIFTSFAEDVHLLRPQNCWRDLLESLRRDHRNFPAMAESLWQTMNTGGFSPILREHVLRFNGGLFESTEALPLNAAQLDLLIEAASADWADVEPSIFGTLLERALSPAERSRLGAHYTPRAYVERLVIPTIVEPLRDDWKAIQAAAYNLDTTGQRAAAIDEVKSFHRRLCNTHVLDPACGSGNFLYVSFEHMKRLEGEVLDTLESLGETQTLLENISTVSPQQFLGLELNPRAAHITDLVLWIGYLQWHHRTHGARTNPPEPVIARFHNIENRDAVLAYDRVEPALGPDGQPLTQWDGRTMKRHPVTNAEVPDESARRPVQRYINPRKPIWPQADFIIGNPPFIGNWRMRGELGDGYVEALRALYRNVPESAEYVMYWWDRAAELVQSGDVRRFGFIATNSLHQTFNRRVLAGHMTGENRVSLLFAIPDHPWVDNSDGAAVRISMTVASKGTQEGRLCLVTAERPAEDGAEVALVDHFGQIQSDLTIGADVAGARPLEANEGLGCRGVSLHGSGFIVGPEQALSLGLGRIPSAEDHIRPYRNGRDIADHPRDVMVIDLFGLSIDEVRLQFPEIYQWVHDRVKPERDHNNRATYRDNWWIFGEPRSNFRPALSGLSRYVATVETAKHRVFVFLDTSILPDNMLVNIALDDAYFLGVLSSRIHVTWALAQGGTLEDRPRYNKTRCFDTFPFPNVTEPHRTRIRRLGEDLDAHRKRQQSLHPTLGLTDMYNVLEKLRTGQSLTPKDQIIHEDGLVTVLRTIHDDLDSAVAGAYGWPANLTTAEILDRLVTLNQERTREEEQGQIRYLRPEYQKPGLATPTQTTLDTEDRTITQTNSTRRTPQTRQDWPATLAEQVHAIRRTLATQPATTPAALSKQFTRARANRVEEILKTLTALGQAREVNGRYVI